MGGRDWPSGSPSDHRPHPSTAGLLPEGAVAARGDTLTSGCWGATMEMEAPKRAAVPNLFGSRYQFRGGLSGGRAFQDDSRTSRPGVLYRYYYCCVVHNATSTQLTTRSHWELVFRHLDGPIGGWRETVTPAARSYVQSTP